MRQRWPEQHAIDRQPPSVEVHAVATAIWVCRSGSPARLSRWVKAVATRPRTLTCRIIPARSSEQGMLLDERKASCTAALTGAFDDKLPPRVRLDHRSR